HRRRRRQAQVRRRQAPRQHRLRRHGHPLRRRLPRGGLLAGRRLQLRRLQAPRRHRRQHLRVRGHLGQRRPLRRVHLGRVQGQEADHHGHQPHRRQEHPPRHDAQHLGQADQQPLLGRRPGYQVAVDALPHLEAPVHQAPRRRLQVLVRGLGRERVHGHHQARGQRRRGQDLDVHRPQDLQHVRPAREAAREPRLGPRHQRRRLPGRGQGRGRAVWHAHRGQRQLL
ncbi:hypothetical protein E4U41_005179, partial [Claviceps citrina]